MDKKKIWGIAILMSLALIGVVWLQINLIRTSIKVNEREFDAQVFAALNAVVDVLQQDEEQQAFNYYVNGYNAGSIVLSGSTLNGSSGIASKMDIHIGQAESNNPMLVKLMEDVTNLHVCDNCRKREDAFRQQIIYNTRSASLPLIKRINLERVGGLLQKQLSNRGITIPYHYGIFSHKQKGFVVLDDRYLNDEARKSQGENYKTVISSPYKADLYPNDPQTMGLLMIQFPEKGSVIWSSLWKNLLGTILFTAIIMASFIYTITVIFRQKKISEMKTDFINNMTHEFKTPIATISLAADSIGNEKILKFPEKVARFAKIIKQENKRMNSQVEKVLQMAALDRQKNSIKISEVNLNDVVRKAAENIRLQVEKKDGLVTEQLEASHPIVEGDQTHISNIINNLLDNANKYSKEIPEILIRTRNVSGGVEVTIQDNGIGMTAEARKHIFDKFYRVHTGDLHDVKGFGLGLSYVKTMMTAHKGTVEVKSELGKGSAFTLFFPYKH